MQDVKVCVNTKHGLSYSPEITEEYLYLHYGQAR